MDSGVCLWSRGPSVALRTRALPLLLLLIWTSALPASATTKTPVLSLKAHPKSDVVLPCEAPADLDSEDLVLEWTRSDLHHSYVFLFRDGRPLKDSQHPHFKERVRLSDSSLSKGNVSITLQDVGLSDKGHYHCHVPRQSHRRKRSLSGTEPIRIVELIVVKSDHEDNVFHRPPKIAQSAAFRSEASLGFVVFVSLFLQIWK